MGKEGFFNIFRSAPKPEPKPEQPKSEKAPQAAPEQKKAPEVIEGASAY